MSSNDFVEMMILDGCFIIELFKHITTRTNFECISDGWISQMVLTDLLLLENQIPYFTIETLQDSPFNPKNLVQILRILTWEVIPINAPSHPQKIQHLLHLCHCYTVPTRTTKNSASEPNHCPFLNWVRSIPVLKYFFLEKEQEHGERRARQINERMVLQIPSATELEEAGVKFKRLEECHDLTKITFQSGTLLIPRLFIVDAFKPIFMNLVAFEQCMYFKLPAHFSTYITFMDKLVNTAHDVKILQKNGIFESMLSSEEEVAIFFNQSCVEVAIEPDHYLAELFMRVNKYCESR